MTEVLRRLFPTKPYVLFMGLCMPQMWMHVISTGVVNATLDFQLAFHLGMMVALFLSAVILRGGSGKTLSWPSAIDVVATIVMVAVPLCGVLPFALGDVVWAVVAAAGGMGVGWCFLTWFAVYCAVDLRDAFCYTLLGFALGAFGRAALIPLAWVSDAPMLIVIAALPVLSLLANRRCRALADQGDRPGANQIEELGWGQVLMLCAQIAVYVLIFGNGIVFSVLQNAIPGSLHGTAITLLNYTLRGIFSLVLCLWMVVNSSRKGATYAPLFNAAMLVAAFVLLGLWFVGDLGSVVAYSVVSVARNLVLVLLFLTCLKLAAGRSGSPFFVFGVGRGLYEFSVAAGIVGYSALSGALVGVRIEQSLVYLTAFCVLIFLTSCFFATAKGLGEKASVEEGAAPVAVEASANSGFPRPDEGLEALRGAYALSDREFEILALFYRGNSKRRIAETLSLSENTVRWYLQQIYAQLGVHSRDELLELVESGVDGVDGRAG